MLPMPKRMLTYRNSDRFSSPILASDVCPAGLEEPESVKEEIPCDAGFSALTWKFRSKDYQIQVDERPSVKGRTSAEERYARGSALKAKKSERKVHILGWRNLPIAMRSLVLAMQKGKIQ